MYNKKQIEKHLLDFPILLTLFWIQISIGVKEKAQKILWTQAWNLLALEHPKAKPNLPHGSNLH